MATKYTITSVGKHRVKCGSIMNGIEDLMGDEKADLIYSDPPWGQGNLNYWQTINKRHTGQEKETIDYEEFLHRIFLVFRKYAKNVVLLEYGKKWQKDITKMAHRYGFGTNAIIEVLYRGGSKLLPLDLHILSKSPQVLPEGYENRVLHSHGFKTLELAVPPFATPGGILLDPLCGMGYSARVGVNNGMIFRGNELNATRLKKTIAFLEKTEQRRSK